MVYRHIHITTQLTDLTLISGGRDDCSPLLEGVCFGHVNSYRGYELSLPADTFLHEWATRFESRLNGKDVSFRDIPLNLDWVTPFQKAVLGATRLIERGEVVSYARLARRCGRPKAVRATASVLRNNRFPLIIPCHRVVRGDGRIGGFCGAGEGNMVALKKALLEMEGNTCYGPKSIIGGLSGE